MEGLVKSFKMAEIFYLFFLGGVNFHLKICFGIWYTEHNMKTIACNNERFHTFAEMSHNSCPKQQFINTFENVFNIVCTYLQMPTNGRIVWSETPTHTQFLYTIDGWCWSSSTAHAKFWTMLRSYIEGHGASEYPELFSEEKPVIDMAYKNVPQCAIVESCLLYTSPSPRDLSTSRMPSSA